MSLEIKITSVFQRSAKKLKKRYRKIVEDLELLMETLINNPQAGDAIPGLYNCVWKIRMASSDMKKGKSGGFRIVYYYIDKDEVIYLLDIYSKGEKEDINISDIKGILEDNSLVIEE